MSRRPKPAPPVPPLDWPVAAGVALVAVAAFLPTLANGFVTWDDDRNFLTNPHWRGLGPAQLGWMLTTPHLGLWVPLTWATLGLDYLLWGLRPAGYHATSLALHAATAGVVYLVALRLLAAALGAGARDTAVRLGAAFAALAFALHPLRVESVAWVTERRDVLSGLLYAATLLLYVRALDATGDRRRRLRRATLGAAVLALLAKPMAVSLPAVLLLLDAYPLGRLAGLREAWPRVREKLALILLSAAASAIAVWAMATGSRLSGASQLGVLDRAAISLYALAFYLEKTLAPTGLAPLYELPFRLEPLAPRFLASAAVVLALTALAVLLRRRATALAASLAAYVVILLPVVGVAHQGPQIAADRYTYLASLPWALLAGGGLARGWRGLRARRPGRPAALALAAIAGALLLTLGVLTWRQAGTWRDSETLWTRALAASPSAIAHAKLGVLRDEAGRPDEAIAHFRAALDLHPDLAYAHNNWGIALARQGKWEEAIEHYRGALRIAPDSAESHLNLAVALDRAGRPAEAAEHLRAAGRLRGAR